MRKVWKFEPRLCEMSEIKIGDLFQVQKANSHDVIDEGELHLAVTDAEGYDPENPEKMKVTASPLFRRLVNDRSVKA